MTELFPNCRMYEKVEELGGGVWGQGQGGRLEGEGGRLEGKV